MPDFGKAKLAHLDTTFKRRAVVSFWFKQSFRLKTEGHTRKYVIYRRVSSSEQRKSGLGVEAQTRDIQLFLDNYAESPYEVVADIVETDTVSDNDRPQLNAAIALAK